MYLVEGYASARFTWPGNGWLTRDGNPVANAEHWQDLIRVAGRVPISVEIKWVKGHKQSPHNKAADKLARRSAQVQTGRRASVVRVRRKTSTKPLEIGSVRMQGQLLTIRIINDQYLSTQNSNKYMYEVMSKGSAYHRNVDVIYSSRDIVLLGGHTYYVRVNTDQKAPRVVKLFREIA